jgi:hypothetical protein
MQTKYKNNLRDSEAQRLSTQQSLAELVHVVSMSRQLSGQIRRQSYRTMRFHLLGCVLVIGGDLACLCESRLKFDLIHEIFEMATYQHDALFRR